jgi:LPXTG-site transpeptidase (sortase) family protein
LYYTCSKNASINGKNIVIQPLFPQQDDPNDRQQQDKDYLLRHRHGRKIEPVSRDLIAPHTVTSHAAPSGDSPAVELIRRKVHALYDEEPDAKQEAAQAEVPAPPARSKHQQFMHELSNSGKSLAHIQTAWHNYYVSLPDDEKHAVWQEFYAANNQRPTAYTQYATVQRPHLPTPKAEATSLAQPAPTATVSTFEQAPATTLTHQAKTHRRSGASRGKDHRSIPGVKKHLLKQVRVNTKQAAKAKQHAQSLLFGLISGALTLLVFFFGFFNEVIIAPFIQPSRHVSATPIIVDSDSVAPSETPEVIIPKINVQLPTVYDVTSMAEADIQAGLERGVVHYPTTVLPGQQGNAAVFGHSSNNIFNKGKYKFAFVLLRELVPGDVFYLTYDKKVYSYRVFDKKIVAPSETSVLNPVEGKAATATLITCDPPGTSTNRLVVWGEQISPDPAAAAAPITPPVVTTDTTPVELPSEGPTLWNRLWNSIF